MKQWVSVLLGCVYLLGAAYYGVTSAYAVRDGGAASREAIAMLIAAVWIGLGGLGLVMGRRWAWWSLMAFFLVTSGAHLNRLLAQRPVIADLGALDQLLWNVAHLAILVWLRHHTGSKVHRLISQGA